MSRPLSLLDPQEALNVLDRVAYVTPYAGNPCLQMLSGREFLPCTFCVSFPMHPRSLSVCFLLLAACNDPYDYSSKSSILANAAVDATFGYSANNNNKSIAFT